MYFTLHTLHYRPISNLPFISMVLERAVNERMLVHLQTNGLMPKHQSAYRRGHSTETAFLKVTSDALLAADQGKLTLLGILDLSAAFDCVDHDILLNRLEKSFGFFGMAFGWIRSYLTGRRQYVRYSGSMSTVTTILFEVHQGSVLGPLLFVLYSYRERKAVDRARNLDCTGSTFPHESSSNSVCWLSGASTGLTLLILQTTSSQLVQLKDGQIYDQRLPASCAFRAPRL